MLRYNWTVTEADEIYRKPLIDLVLEAQQALRLHFPANRIQRSSLVSLRTGGCTEDCAYCAQSLHHRSGVPKQDLMDRDSVLDKARQAKAEGSTRLCMAVSGREIKNEAEFDYILEVVREVAKLGLEPCCTLGSLTLERAKRLKEAGCVSYNHNLDTSPEYYGRVITTRTYQDRLDTIKNVHAAGIPLCCGGILGMGESIEDRLRLLVELACQEPHPASVPINVLIKIEGTPLADCPPVESFELVRLIATARIMMPKSLVRLSAGRAEMNDETQALCFLAGANGIFAGEKLLTAANPGDDHDNALMAKLGVSFLENI